MTKTNTRHTLLFLDHDRELAAVIARSRDELGIRENDEFLVVRTREAAQEIIDALAREGRKVDMLITEMILNEKPAIAYTRMAHLKEFEGIQFFERNRDYIRRTCFLTEAAPYRMAFMAGFRDNGGDVRSILKTNPVEARNEDRFPNNLIRFIAESYQSLDAEDGLIPKSEEVPWNPRPS